MKHTVFTFDPFATTDDLTSTAAGLTRTRVFPFLIADVDARVPFHVHDHFPDCSTVNTRHQHYDVGYQIWLHRNQCGTTRKDFLKSKLSNCTHAPLRTTIVHGKRLSTFVRQQRVTSIGDLVIDAQGSDFAILKDFVANAATVAVARISVMCQRMNETVPRWLVSNDCGDVLRYMRRYFNTGLTVVEERVNCQANEFRITFSNLVHNNNDSTQPAAAASGPPPVLVDIDIGTLGKPIKSSANKLITFDPFDKPLMQERYERHSFVVSDVDDDDGSLPFFVNDRAGGCSTLNLRNEHYDVAYQNRVHQQCGKTRKAFLESRLHACMHFPQRRMRVRSMRLSRFVRARNITRVGILKIDAQGSDFAILKDLVENIAPEFSVDSVIVECQVLNESVPLYFVANDCGDIQQYMAEKFERFEVVKQSNNCNVKEFNLIYSGLRRRHGTVG